jgi:hypothetical protein
MFGMMVIPLAAITGAIKTSEPETKTPRHGLDSKPALKPNPFSTQAPDSEHYLKPNPFHPKTEGRLIVRDKADNGLDMSSETPFMDYAKACPNRPKQLPKRTLELFEHMERKETRCKNNDCPPRNEETCTGCPKHEFVARALKQQ